MVEVQGWKLRLLCAFVWVLKCGANCPYQECSCAGTTIICDNQGLTMLPRVVTSGNSDFPVLLLDDNQITNVSAGDLPAGLGKISLLANPIVYIDDLAFNGSADTLTTLMLSNVSFTRIPDAFFQLNTLKMLTLYYARILDWNTDAMKHIGLSVEKLYLECVGLKTWPTWIQYFHNLTELTIIGSDISSIPDGALDDVSDCLEALYFYSNRLTSVSPSISKLTALQVLNLNDNDISDVSGLPQSSRLQMLYLNGNNISDPNELSNALLPYGSTLNNLFLKGNHLTQIPNLDFLIKIASLDFSINKISDPDSGSVPPTLVVINLSYNLLSSVPRIISSLNSVFEINLSFNAITEFHDVDFPSDTTRIWLGFNVITELTDTSFPQNSRLKFLNLNNNPLTTISSLAFRNLPELKQLNLRSTKLSRLPLALSALTNLAFFDISNCTDLVCTCQENDLESWIKSMPESFVTGDCGQISVYKFMVDLSSSCPD